MKGSGVRVPASALRSFPVNAVVPPQRPVEPGSVWGLHGVQTRGPEGSTRVRPGLKFEGGFIAARATEVAEIAMTQLALPLDSDDDAYLTIAEAAAAGLRCCERTIRRAIESGALRGGRIRGGRRSRGAWRIPAGGPRHGSSGMTRRRRADAGAPGPAAQVETRRRRRVDGSVEEIPDRALLGRGGQAPAPDMRDGGGGRVRVRSDPAGVEPRSRAGRGRG
jgi:hypothetical protein